MTIDSEVACTSVSHCLEDGRGAAFKRHSRRVLGALALATLSGIATAQVPPNDADRTCVVDPGKFAAWFNTGTVTANGVVNPADSLDFDEFLDVPPGNVDPSMVDCNFYKWAEQMFLSVTSPANRGRWVFESPEFYSVSPPGRDGKRTLKRNTNRKIDFVLRRNKAVEERGEPNTRGVLMAGNQSLVYYAIDVNDVYAYFLTGTRNGGIKPTPTQFPDEPLVLDSIKAVAASDGVELHHTKALTVEVKSAWVETTALDASKYITMTARIPTYKPDPSNHKLTPIKPIKWRQAQLALVGLHVVGSVQGVPALVWATFEHIDNAPMARYTYNNTSKATVSVDPDPAGRWLFSAHNCTGPANQETMTAGTAGNVPTIYALPGKTIGPIDTCRENAWGTGPADPLLVINNTKIIAINTSIMNMLQSGDVRRNYLMVGVTWGPGQGSTQLANTTLETFQQGQNCSNCHIGDLAGGKLSHIFDALEPLFPYRRAPGQPGGGGTHQ